MTVSCRRSACGRAAGWVHLAQGGNGSQQSLPIAQRHAKRGQIGVGQVGDDVEIDLVRAKYLGVPVQAHPMQPRLDFQALLPRNALPLGSQYHANTASSAAA